MNEFSILMGLLSRKQQPNSKEEGFTLQGATEKEICDVLKISGQHAKTNFNHLLNRFSHSIQALGLNLRRNPINSYWFISLDHETVDFLGSSPFSNRPRLAATLCAILALTLNQREPVDLEQLQSIRLKQDLKGDLEELAAEQFIILEGNRIHLHPSLGYYLDFERFLELVQKAAI
jgi:hypothetical protein